MALVNEVWQDSSSSRQELLDAQAHVWNQMLSFINSMSLKCAIQLGIPDAVHKHGKPMTLSQLADALPINKKKSHGLYRLMRILTHSKLFDNVKISEEEEAYCLTLASCLLLRDGPVITTPLARANLNPIMIDPWHHMSEWFQNDESTPFVTKHGKTFWQYGRDDQWWNQMFNEAMACDAWPVAVILSNEGKQVFEGLKSMVDVGGGNGATAKPIVNAFPGLKYTVLDLPHVVAGLERVENLTYVGGDMFESIPHADAVLLKALLHDWNDEDCVKILEKCKEAVLPSKNKGGKVIIVEMVVGNHKEDHEATETQLFMDMQMMVQITGKERTEKEWAKLFFDAGFGNYKINPVLGLRAVIEVFP